MAHLFQKSWRALVVARMGPWVRRLRLQLGLSDKRLALRAGVPVSVWAYFEAGETEISSRQLADVASLMLERLRGGPRRLGRAKSYVAQQFLALLAS